MRKFLATAMSLLMVVAFSATVSSGQSTCPPEVASAKAMLTQTAKSQDVQAPRSLAGAKSQDVQAPRSQDVQAPRSQDVQAPRSANLKKATALVSEAEAACKAGNTATASAKAKAAMEMLKK